MVVSVGPADSWRIVTSLASGLENVQADSSDGYCVSC